MAVGRRRRPPRSLLLVLLPVLLCLHPLSSPLSLLCRASTSSGIGGGGRHPRKAVVGDKNTHASTVVPPIIGSDDYADYALPWGDINVVVVTDVHSWIGRTRRRRRRGDDDTGWNKGRTTGDDGDDGDDDDDDGVLGERSLDADYGHVLSFYQRLKEYADGESGINGGEGEAAVEAASASSDRIINKKRRDLFFVMNGDFLDGTGLSTVPPQYLAPLLRQYMPWDAINVGNHELYHDETVQYLIESGFIDHWNGTYLSSNTLLAASRRPLGQRYAYLHGRHSNTTVLTFGFLYNFVGNCPMTVVKRVQDVVRQPWMVQVLSRGGYDAILVLAHMDCTDPLVAVILNAIRHVVGQDMPIQFVTGHTHRRAYAVLDDRATSFEAGRYLDTVGFVSFPTMETAMREQRQQRPPSSSSGPPPPASPTSSSPPLFRYQYVDANQRTLQNVLRATVHGIETVATGTEMKDDEDDEEDRNKGNRSSDALMLPWFGTPRGIELSRLIHETQHRLGLDRVLGCSRETYHQLSVPFFGSEKSLWRLYLDHVIPTQLFDKIDDDGDDDDGDGGIGGKRRIFVQGTGAFRYDLFRGEVTLDDVIAVCPFNDSIFKLTDSMYGWQILETLEEMQVQYGRGPVVGATNTSTASHPTPTIPAFATAPAIEDIDPRQSYALYVPDFEFYRMVPIVTKILTRERDADMDDVVGNAWIGKYRTNKSEPSVITRRPVCYRRKQQGTTMDDQCFYTTDLWKTYVVEEMPCLQSRHYDHSQEENSFLRRASGTVLSGSGHQDVMDIGVYYPSGQDARSTIAGTDEGSTYLRLVTGGHVCLSLVVATLLVGTISGFFFTRGIAVSFYRRGPRQGRFDLRRHRQEQEQEQEPEEEKQPLFLGALMRKGCYYYECSDHQHRHQQQHRPTSDSTISATQSCGVDDTTLYGSVSMSMSKHNDG